MSDRSGSQPPSGAYREKTFDSIAYTAAQLVRAPIAMLILSGRDGPYVKAAVHPHTLDPALPETLARIVLQARRRTMVPDIGRDPRFTLGSMAQQPRSAAALPLFTAEDSCVGCLCLMRYGYQEFTGAELDQLAALARHAGTVLQSFSASMDLVPAHQVPGPPDQP